MTGYVEKKTKKTKQKKTNKAKLSFVLASRSFGYGWRGGGEQRCHREEAVCRGRHRDNWIRNHGKTKKKHPEIFASLTREDKGCVPNQSIHAWSTHFRLLASSQCVKYCSNSLEVGVYSKCKFVFSWFRVCIGSRLCALVYSTMLCVLLLQTTRQRLGASASNERGHGPADTELRQIRQWETSWLLTRPKES